MSTKVYKHYKGKEDILNALIDSAEVRYEEMFGSLWDLFPIILVHDLVRRGE